MFEKIAQRRHLRKTSLDNVVRRDTSYDDLTRYKNDGYTQAVFVKNPLADPECEKWDGKVWGIDELLSMDPIEHNVIFWISHPNCLCKFSPYGKSSKNLGQQVERAPLIQKPEVPPMTIEPANPQSKMV